LTANQEQRFEAFVNKWGTQHSKYNFIYPNCTDPVEDGLRNLGYKPNFDIFPSSLLSDIMFNLRLNTEIIRVPESNPNVGVDMDEYNQLNPGPDVDY
jgi:hypothetical protein